MNHKLRIFTKRKIPNNPGLHIFWFIFLLSSFHFLFKKIRNLILAFTILTRIQVVKIERTHLHLLS